MSTESLKADIAIIGGGGAGLAAAVTAAEAGVKNVVVLETRHVPGGNSLFPSGILGAETALQRRMGVEASRDDVFRKAMDYTHWKANARLVRALIDKSGDSIRWLEEKGVKFAHLVPHYSNQVPSTYHACGGAEKAGVAVVKTLVKTCQQLGVRILCQTAAKKLLTDGKGKVTGVLAESEGKELRIDAKSVIIATGGFAGNGKLIKQYLPSYNEGELNLKGLPHKGDGLTMASEAGAATGDIVTLETEAPDFRWSNIITTVARRPVTVWVNKKGERFTDENAPSIVEAANAIYEQPGKASYSLFDEKIKQSIMEEDLSPFEKLFTGTKSWQSGVEKDLKEQAKNGRIKISDSLEETARWMEIAPETLEYTINKYNSFCDRGHDALFNKNRRYLAPLRTPPYYAIPCRVALLVTHGGIRVNHHMQALDRQSNPIRGLYAAGSDIAGTSGDTYNIFLSGLSFSFAVSSGRIAGNEAAEYAANRK